ncbi:MAG: hypothetical protein ACYSSL_00215 [Planctomycetota bacterium]
MKIKKTIIVMLVVAGLLQAGCSCTTWTNFWGGDPEKECATHWRFNKHAKPFAHPEKKEVALSPCDIPQISKTEQSYPLISIGENVVRLEKLVPKEVQANQQFDYRLKVTNLTNHTLQNVMIKDQLPSNLKMQSSAPKVYKVEAGESYWAIGKLGPKASEVVVVNAIAEGKGVIVSCAEVTYDCPTCTTINIVEPMLTLTKYAPTESLMCERIPLRYVVTNKGTGFACDIEVKEQLQQALMTAKGENMIMFRIDSLGPGKSQEFKTMVDASRAGRYSGKAILTSSFAGEVESNLTSTLVSKPVLTINESCPSNQYTGRSLTYEITVMNRGDGIAKEAVIEAMVPEGAQFNSATGNGRFTHASPGKVTWNLGTLTSQDSKTVSMMLTPAKSGAFVSMATAKAFCADTVSTSCQTTLAGIPAILLEVVDVSDPVEIGQNETYVITVTNQGSAPDTNIQITCALEDNMEYVSSSGRTTASIMGNELTFAPLVSLAPKTRAIWRVNIKATDAGDMRFKATINSDQLNRPVEETEATTFYR